MTLEDFRKITQQRSWESYAKQLLQEPTPSAEISRVFGTYWIEAGHRIREQLGDDQALAHLLRHVLLPYEGIAVMLYRGENLARWEDRSVGFAWTSNVEVARMFGRGLNAISSGGVLLEGSFPPEAIISGPNDHSLWLGEEQFTIDPFHETILHPIEFFPPIS